MALPARTVGIVGLGFGRAHIPAFQAHRCEVVAVCQRDQAAARKVAQRYGIPRAFERWEQMLEQALVKRFLAATRKGYSPSPSFEDGMRAQAVLDAVLESIASGGRMVSI